MKAIKPKIGIFSLSCCEGCENAISEYPREFLKLANKAEIVEFRLLEDAPIKFENWDVAFIEGSAITAANLEMLKKIRKYAKILVTLGNCAEFGGIHKIKNYRGKEKLAKAVYKNYKEIDNFEIEDIKNLVRVDYNVPGCPVNPEEFLRIAFDLISGKIPRIQERAVCYECQRRGFPCLLQKGEPCLGPITLGGCNAVCLESRMPCEGCRGFYEGANFKSLFKLIDKQVGKKRREEILEIFGIKDRLEKKIKK
ncbi:MAG: NADH:ubiquinone oxidoreductase [Patescibacteria group bacterium]